LNRKEVLKGKNFVIEVLPFLKKRKRWKMSHTSKLRFALFIKR
jgi:hypothetical protein